MAVAIHSFKLDQDGGIAICHTFYGVTEREAKSIQKATPRIARTMAQRWPLEKRSILWKKLMRCPNQTKRIYSTF
jgi:hypothetical protein